MILQNVLTYLPQLIAFHVQKISAPGTLQMKMMLASHACSVLIDKTVRTRRLKPTDNPILQKRGGSFCRMREVLAGRGQPWGCYSVGRW